MFSDDFLLTTPKERCGQKKNQRGNRHLQQVVVVVVVGIAGSPRKKKFSRSIVHKATAETQCRADPHAPGEFILSFFFFLMDRFRG